VLPCLAQRAIQASAHLIVFRLEALEDHLFLNEAMYSCALRLNPSMLEDYSRFLRASYPYLGFIPNMFFSLYRIQFALD
jgi:hypothetical protein